MKMAFKRLGSLHNQSMIPNLNIYLHWTINVLIVRHPEEKEKASEVTRREMRFLFNSEELRP